MKTGSFLAMLLLALIALAHFIRLVLRVQLTVDGINIPQWLSIIACVVPALIAVMLWLERGESYTLFGQCSVIVLTIVLLFFSVDQNIRCILGRRWF